MQESLAGDGSLLYKYQFKTLTGRVPGFNSRSGAKHDYYKSVTASLFLR